MKLNKKSTPSLLMLFIASTFLFACNNGDGENFEPFEGLKFTATQDASSISYTITGYLPDISIQYSLDNGATWAAWTYDIQTQKSKSILLNDGKSLCVKNISNTLSKTATNYFNFTISGQVSASGDVSSMINNSSLTDYCYYRMFKNCASLTSAPTLPANILANNCYQEMFYGCASLTSAPTLPATTLEIGCYRSMFRDCTSLTSTPMLLADTLKNYCYYRMFYGCKKLYVVEDDIVSNPTMIFSCPSTSESSLSIDEMFAETGGAFTNDAPTTGNIYYWYVDNPLKFTAIQDDSSIGYDIIGSLTNINIQYSLDGGISWTNWSNGSTKVNLNNHESVCVRNTTNTLSIDDEDYFYFTMTGKIEASGEVSSMINNKKTSKCCYYQMFKNCISLTQAPDLLDHKLSESCYEGMFSGCTSLISTPTLPATSLAENCYQEMFSGCTSLEFASTLPASELEPSCYRMMFTGCSALTSAPELPATILKDFCYYQMFSGCLSLKAKSNNKTCDGIKIFECPDTSGLISPVDNMFTNTSGAFIDGTPVAGVTYYWYVDSLKFTATMDNSSIGYDVIGSLPNINIQYSLDNGTTWISWDDESKTINLNKGQGVCVRNTNNTLSNSNSYFKFIMTGEIAASGDVYSMINNAIYLSDYCYRNMFNGCAALTSAPLLFATTLTEGCYHSMFKGCTNLSSAPLIIATTLADSCCQEMFSGCTALTSAPILQAEKMENYCYYSMFEGCTALTSTPLLPAITLAENCYREMFSGCTALISTSSLPVNTLVDSCYREMFKDCKKLKIKDDNSTGDGTKIFKCPITGGSNDSVKDMFANTGGVFIGETPSVGNTYYWYI